MIPESTISPAPDLVNSESFTDAPDTSLLASTVVLKLNGGLGTGMGLDKAKSLLIVKGSDTFLDLTAKQIVSMREEFKSNVKFMLMNSFSTSADTLDFFNKNYPALTAEEGLEMMQNKVPKIDEITLEVSHRFQNSQLTRKIRPKVRNLMPCEILSLRSQQLVHPTQTTSGVLLAMVTCMLPWKDLEVLTIS
jgi:UDP-N-acetylglucosamine pyrophosphorylase